MGGPEIVTEGSGWHEQTADRADVDLTYTASARTRADAVRELGRQVAAAEPHLGHRAVQVRHRRLWVHNEWRGRRVVGCRAGQEISLRLTDVAALEEVLSALIGTEPSGLNGPRWLLDDRASALREAQRRAVEDARHRAEGYAEALGGRIGALLLLSEAAEHGPVAYRAMDMAESGGAGGGPDVRDLGLEPEPVRVSARCTTRWTLITES
ncbi:SIMPL domain-containing protein [Pseudonocardia humida]|uniref:SIMPL domain-containing protein n=1 Tax=Pseudonocardia humida TaxID=2800819 RepID=A0ABT1A1X0_9PSEU|nr:SIMPL domain-containing protein [Pseudonocardia humida]MCO1656915.1 SIMPL domain-containing protein [Pseudonocardia humida]